jgi:hypothetical protein
MSSIKRPDASEYDARYSRYMELVPETDLPRAMAGQIDETRRLILSIPKANLDSRYAPGEWTPREILGHILDTERLFGVRLLCFARGDGAAFERADQDLYVRSGEFERYAIEDLLREFELVRQAHLSLLSHLPPAAWERMGRVGGLPISVRAIGYLMLGHERHHLGTIQGQYLKDGG